MENVVLTVHLILALLMIAVVLLQRSEGGGLLSGGGAMSARGAANALTKLTWILAAVFIATSIALTVIAAQKSQGTSVLDATTSAPAGPADAPATPALPEGDLLPPTAGDAPVAPPPAD
ncbi:MAG: preprotein translocase subunit SecG [Rhodobacteraceae bacterium]|nr:preprotein translocase subunit SecG [Paracoccaceae bacterium]